MIVTFEGKSYDGARLLHALYHHAQPVGLGQLEELARRHTGEAGLTIEQAQAMVQTLEQHNWPYRFDYVMGRPIKVKGDAGGVLRDVSEVLFDRDAGAGAFRRALAAAEVPP